mmetsp:Transcript_9829/g.10592  ORF Transcript_9829/g.10592 Transcript_9829/m.10592 type:complete len:82 (+) Transcript_9829:2933-3178(+)
MLLAWMVILEYLGLMETEDVTNVSNLPKEVVISTKYKLMNAVPEVRKRSGTDVGERSCVVEEGGMKDERADFLLRYYSPRP